MAETSLRNITRYRAYTADCYSMINMCSSDHTDDFTYVSATSAGYNPSEIIYDGITFPQITDWTQITITGYKIRVRGGQAALNWSEASKKKCYLEYWLTMGYTKQQKKVSTVSGTKINGSATQILFGTKDGNSPVTTINEWYEHSITDPNDTSIQWMNANKSLISEGTDFGIRVSGRAWRAYEMGMILYYTPISNIYIGGGSVSKIYVGGTPAKAVYLGSTQIL